MRATRTARGVERDAGFVVLEFHVSSTEPELESTVAQEIERGGLARQHHRVAEVVVDDERPESQRLGRLRSGGERRKRSEHAVDEMVRHEQGVEAGRLGPPGLAAPLRGTRRAPDRHPESERSGHRFLLALGREPDRLTLVLVIPAFAMIAFGDRYAGASPYSTYGIYYIVLFVWVGLTQPPRTSVGLAPVATIFYLAPMWGANDVYPGAGVSAVATIAVCFLVGETVAWAVDGLRNARKDADHRATLLRAVAGATTSITGLEWDHVLIGVVDAATSLGFEIAAPAVFTSVPRIRKRSRFSRAVVLAGGSRRCVASRRTRGSVCANRRHASVHAHASAFLTSAHTILRPSSRLSTPHASHIADTSSSPRPCSAVAPGRCSSGLPWPPSITSIRKI